MKIFANKEIKKLFLAVSVIWVAFLLLTQGFLWLCYQRFSLFLLLVFVLAGGAILAVGCSYFKKQNQVMEQAVSQINAYLDGDHNARIECDDEGELYRLFHTVNSLAAVLNAHADNELREKEFLKNTISDISHQVKTPIANLKIINNTLLENEVPPQKQKEFLTAQASQLDKLDFLMQAMIKTSRLETGVISLEQKQQPVYDTLAAALGGILLNAEKKQIDVQVECPEHLDARHDRKWTSEALFNILDNAVKYTPAGGQIRVSVEGWEMYVKIDIADTGIGISEQHQGTIFKRFYREDAVHDVDGIGIGLYLAREIVTLQGGYIRVVSEVGKGSTFSVFLLRK